MSNDLYPKYQKQPILLTKEAIKEPIVILRLFFERYNLLETRQQLWVWLSGAIRGSAIDAYNGDDVGEWILFHRNLSELLEAAWVIAKESNN